MKSAATYLGLFAACMAGVLLAAPLTSANNASSEITVKRITLTSDDGKCTITVAAGTDNVGLWVNKKGEKTYAYMFADARIAPYIAIGNESSKGDPIALTVDGDKPQLQIRVGGNTNIVDVEKLIKPAAVENADDDTDVSLHAKPAAAKCFGRRGRCNSEGNCKGFAARSEGCPCGTACACTFAPCESAPNPADKSKHGPIAAPAPTGHASCSGSSCGSTGCVNGQCGNSSGRSYGIIRRR